MTITTTTSSSGPYIAAAQTTFAVTFQSGGAGEIMVLLDDVIQSPTLYTFTRDADGTGSVVFTTAVTGTVWIHSDPSYQQSTTFTKYGAWNPSLFNSPLDKAAVRAIALKAKVDLLLPTALLAPTARASKFLAWDAGGLPIASSGIGADAALRTDLAALTGPTLIGIGNGSTLNDLIRVNAAEYGFRPGLSAAANLTALSSAITANGGGAQPTIIDIPPGTYAMDLLGVSLSNIWIDAHDSTFTGGARISTAPSATGFKLKNARFYLDTPDAIITLNSSGGGLQNIDLIKFGAGDGYMAMTEATTDNVFNAIRFTGGNGMFIEGERLLFNNIHGVGRAAGGDDFLVLKARNRRTGDIQFSNIFAKNYSNGLAVGGEVGTLGAASALRAGRIENILLDMVLRDTAYGIFIKLGAVDAGASYDWRDGLLRGLNATIRIHDGDGSKMRRAAVVSAARNALVEKVRIALHGTGRFANTAETECWANIFLPDSTGWVSGGAGGTIRDVDLELSGHDIYDGAENSAGAPGYPPLYGVSIEKQAAAVGTMDRIRVTADINGTQGAGIIVTPGLDNVVTIEKFIGRNLAVTPPSTTGGVHAESIIRMPGKNEISMASATYKPIYVAGTGDVIGKRIALDVNTAAGVDATLYRQLNHDTWLRKLSGVPKDTVGVNASVYLSLELRMVAGVRYDGTAFAGNPITALHTNATALTADTPFPFSAMPLSGVNYDDRFLRADATLRVVKTNTGGGQPYTGVVNVDYVQIGKAV